VGARAPVHRTALKGLRGIFATGTALACFALAAAPNSPGGAAGTRGGISPGAFYLPYQFSSFADDTALYANAYAAAGSRARDTCEGGTKCCTRAAGDGSVRAGTVSHHLFIRELIARYFSELARRVHPETIILLGPNHHARGHSPIALSALRWRTPFGFVEPDIPRILQITRTGLARIEEEPFVHEHSIGALVPFIRRTFPGAEIVPIIFKKDADRGTCVELARTIAQGMDGALVLASLDFSHYKTSREAELEDRASLAVIRSLGSDRVDDAYVDSRPALLTLMSICRIIGAGSVEVVEHTNSGILAHDPAVPCTSYINTFIEKAEAGK